MSNFLRLLRNCMIATLLAWLGISAAPTEKPEAPEDPQSYIALFR